MNEEMDGIEQNSIKTTLSNVDEALAQLSKLPKRKYTRQEKEEARGNMAFMDDRVFLHLFSGNKNNRILTGIANTLRKIHGLPSIPPIERVTVQGASLIDVLGRGMVGDLLGEGHRINITIEAQKGRQAGYAVRGSMTSGSAMRAQFNPGEDYTEAPDVISINIMDFKLPELKNREMFYSRIVRAEYESKEPFLDWKYSDYYIELPKMASLKKETLPPELHELWELCSIFTAKVKEHEEVIRVQGIKSKTALELSKEVKKTVAARGFTGRTLSRKEELEELRRFIERREQKLTQEAAQKAQEEMQKVQEEMQKATNKAKQSTAEKMILAAVQNFVPKEAIEAMCKSAGITGAHLAKLMELAKNA